MHTLSTNSHETNIQNKMLKKLASTKKKSKKNHQKQNSNQNAKMLGNTSFKQFTKKQTYSK